jgi:hypothetical protein
MFQLLLIGRTWYHMEDILIIFFLKFKFPLFVAWRTSAKWYFRHEIFYRFEREFGITRSHTIIWWNEAFRRCPMLQRE